MRKIGLDARALEHPQPLEMAMKILQTLEENSYLYMLHRKKPLPLLDLAKKHKLSSYLQEDKNKNWHIIISKNTNEDLSQYIDV